MKYIKVKLCVYTCIQCEQRPEHILNYETRVAIYNFEVSNMLLLVARYFFHFKREVFLRYFIMTRNIFLITTYFQYIYIFDLLIRIFFLFLSRLKLNYFENIGCRQMH